jgi:hypothetical protein
MLTSGSLLGKYRIERALGQGGAGTELRRARPRNIDKVPSPRRLSVKSLRSR